MEGRVAQQDAQRKERSNEINSLRKQVVEGKRDGETLASSVNSLRHSNAKLLEERDNLEREREVRTKQYVKEKERERIEFHDTIEPLKQSEMEMKKGLLQREKTLSLLEITMKKVKLSQSSSSSSFFSSSAHLPLTPLLIYLSSSHPLTLSPSHPLVCCSCCCSCCCC